MADVDLNLILRQYERILHELRAIREDQRGMRLDVLSLRDELRLPREQTNIMGSAISLRRLEDTITMNVLDRIQKLEDTTPE